VNRLHPDYPDHPARPSQEQQLHDQVIELLADHLKQEGLEVLTNRGQEQENAVDTPEGSHFPDVLGVEEDQVIVICEVETESTIQPDAVTQWKDYADLANAFLLVVPEPRADDAQQLLDDHEIPCQRLLTYEVNGNSANGAEE